MTMLNFLFLVTTPPESSLLYRGSYDFVLVSLSVAVAIFASYAALLVSQYVSTAQSATPRRLWTVVGGLCLGVGIWSMHFVGMLAFSLPCSSSYDATITFLSTIPGILASTLALKIISRRELSRTQLATGGLLIGVGIGAMHYSGMAAMRLNGMIRYDITLFALSVLVAVLLATLALWIKFRLQSWEAHWNKWATVASAMVMGLAVSGMHYTAMAAAYFIRDGETTNVTSGISPTYLASIVLAATGLIVVVTIVATYVGKQSLSFLGRSYKLIGLLLVGWGITAWVSADYYYSQIEKNLYQQESQAANQQAENVANNINENIALLKGISLMLSSYADTPRALRRFGANAAPSSLNYEVRKQQWTQDKGLAEQNGLLALTAKHLEADVIYIINAVGDCISSSNADKPDSFVGTNYADREYFRQARAGQPGHQYAVGRTSKAPGLYYSAPVFDKGRFLGAVVVKRNVTKLSHWTSQANAFLADANGVVVLAPDKQLEFRAMPDAVVANLSVEKRLLQYKQPMIDPLPIVSWGDKRFPLAVRMGDRNQPIVLASKVLPEDAISIYVPHPLGDLVRLETERNWLFLLLATAGSMLIIAVSAVVIYLRESQKLAEDLHVAATAFESQEGMVITDANIVILRVNQAFTNITGYSAGEAVGQTPRLLHSGRHDAAFFAAMWDILHRTGFWQGEIWNRRKNGEVYPEWLTITAVKGEGEIITHYVGTLTDISARKAAEDKIQNLAFYDPLTQLPNRRLLMDRLQQALASCARSRQQGALLFIDLDSFKTLNDTLGHNKGDLLLKLVARGLAACVREGDTVARLGGDEFLVMLEDLGENIESAAAQAETIGEKILATLNLSFQLDQHDYQSTASIGVTLFNDPHETVDDLLKRVDIALYEAKTAGRNTLRFFDPEMQSAVMTRASLEVDLREAVLKEQFLLYYQAQVVGDGYLTGVEALLRWRHPIRGMVSPAEFIPLAEDTGLILPIGHWVLQTACGQLAKWAAQPEMAHLTIAVNVSAKQFKLPNFVEEVLAIIDHNEANPHRLKLELTESTLVDDVEDIIAKMAALKAKGVGFSLDDFGTGYSSLSYLKRLPLDQLKIDQGFVRNVLTDPNDSAIAKMVVALAESMGLAVIAEGVETEGQREFLASNGCLAYQGYLFSRPLSLEEFEGDFVKRL